MQVVESQIQTKKTGQKNTKMKIPRSSIICTGKKKYFKNYLVMDTLPPSYPSHNENIEDNFQCNANDDIMIITATTEEFDSSNSTESMHSFGFRNNVYTITSLDNMKSLRGNKFHRKKKKRNKGKCPDS